MEQRIFTHPYGERLTAYVDESYSTNFYFVAAAVVDRYSKVKMDLGLEFLNIDVSFKFDIPSNAEFHAHEMMHGKGDWAALKGNIGESITIYSKALREINNSGAKIFVQGVDIGRLNARYKYPHPPHEVALRHLLEQVSSYTKESGHTSCQVIADTQPLKDHCDDRLSQYRLAGTPGYKRSKLELIDLPVKWASSKDHRGIQAADLAAYIYRRYHDAPPESSNRAKRAVRRLYHTMNLYHHRIWSP